MPSESSRRRSSPASLLLLLLAALPSSSMRASSAGRDMGCGAWARAARWEAGTEGGGGVGAGVRLPGPDMRTTE
ncbi:hypothetical protein DMC30DRAFT_395169 [Rhodotorula diobovata]|uniref:Secreted protein n=1 Tax=Rhodotorula diobovata TaxID=5288 RepID=A0A5C5FYE5_9BASI|nr:hypothetical protein DMC30DRAFT_395169 [Rhodotorula diobovata]